MDIVAAYEQVGTYRGAAALCGTTHKTVKRVIERARAGEPLRAPRRGVAEEHRRGGDGDRREGAGDRRADLGQAAAADGAGGRLHRLGPELPPGRGRGEEARGVASGGSIGRGCRRRASTW